MRDEDGLTPTQALVMEVLSARHRLGHDAWTMSRNKVTTLALKVLAEDGFVTYKSATIENAYLVHLTEEGKKLYLSTNYIAPDTIRYPCPASYRIPRATVDITGFCSEHGPDCSDFRLYLEERD